MISPKSNFFTVPEFCERLANYKYFFSYLHELGLADKLYRKSAPE